MCLVKVEKMPKLQTACTTVIGEGMIVSTDSAGNSSGAQEHGGNAAGQSPARLPGL